MGRSSQTDATLAQTLDAAHAVADDYPFSDSLEASLSSGLSEALYMADGSPAANGAVQFTPAQESALVRVAHSGALEALAALTEDDLTEQLH